MKMTFSPLQNDLLFAVLQGTSEKEVLYGQFVARKKYSRAGFYRAISILKRKEVLLEKTGHLSVSKVWLATSLESLSQFQRERTTPSYLAKQITSLSPKDKLLYSFRSLADVDIFILNILYDLLLLPESPQTVFICEPHEFFILLNESRTKAILKEIHAKGAQVLLLVESASPIDQEALQRPQGVRSHVSGRPTKNLRCVEHVIGDIHIELRLDKAFAISLDKLFSEDADVERVIPQLDRLAHKHFHHQIVITRDHARAVVLHKKFEKYFVLNNSY